jgi:hypothetical protein
MKNEKLLKDWGEHLCFSLKTADYCYCDSEMKSYEMFSFKEVPHEFSNFLVDYNFPNRL